MFQKKKKIYSDETLLWLSSQYTQILSVQIRTECDILLQRSIIIHGAEAALL